MSLNTSEHSSDNSDVPTTETSIKTSDQFKDVILLYLACICTSLISLRKVSQQFSFQQIDNSKSVSLVYFRISVIMRVFKSRTFRTNDSELYKKVLIVILGCTLYMTLWTLIDPATPSKPQEHGSILCKLQPWNFVAIAGKLLSHVNGRRIH